MNYLSTMSGAAQAAASVVLALYALASALSLLLGFVGSFYPPALVWARQCSSVGLRLHNLGTWLGSLLPAGMTPHVAQAMSTMPKPYREVTICPKCGATAKDPS